jgi:hypothetical protein
MKDGALYLEVDEDITSAIDKLKHSTDSSVQIVVPKRSTMLQSIINLKLLKKAADSSGKELVLVTGDRIASDLAGRVGLAVAPSIGAKAVVAEAKVPEALKNEDEVIEADDPEPPTPAPMPSVPAEPPKKPLLKRLPVSDGPPAPAAAANPLETPATSAPEVAGAAAAAASAPAAASAGTGTKSPKVPNFRRLQRRVLWVGLGAFLIVGYLVAMYVLTNAKVTLYATGTRVSIDTTFSVDPDLKTTDTAKGVLAGQLVTVSKDLSGPFVPTGKKDAGTKAAGKMTISNGTGVDQTLVAGTRFAAPDGKVFRSGADTVVPSAHLNSGGDKVNGTVTVDVTADAAGDSYNEAPAAYTLPALANPKITAQGAQMSGGTTKTITIVAQSDVDTEKAALLAKDKDASARDLQGRVPSGYVALPSSQTASADTVSPSPAVGAEGETGTLNLKVNYTVLAVKQSEYEAMLHAQEQKQVGDKNQIYDDGIKAAQVSATDKDASGRQTFHLTTEAYGGTKLDKAKIAADLKGQRYGDAVSAASGLPGVTRAEVSISPAWVSRLPSRPDKINITIQVAAAK